MMLNFLEYRGTIINLLIGSAIIFGSLIFLDIIVYSIMGWACRSLGILGVFAYEEARNAIYIIRLGTVFLSSGFLGGLYVGYKIKENLKIVIVFPGLISLLLTFISQIFISQTPPWGLFVLSLSWLARDVIVPLALILSGSYLGGYTANWKVEEKRLEEETISLIFR